MQEMQRDKSLIPRSERSPGVLNGNTLQYSCLENSILTWKIPWTEEPVGLYIVHGVRDNDKKANEVVYLLLLLRQVKRIFSIHHIV